MHIFPAFEDVHDSLNEALNNLPGVDVVVKDDGSDVFAVVVRFQHWMGPASQRFEEYRRTARGQVWEPRNRYLPVATGEAVTVQDEEWEIWVRRTR